MKSKWLFVLAASLAFCAFSDIARADEDEAKEQANAKKGLAVAKITLSEAIQIALKKVPGKAVAAELEVEGDDVDFEVEIIATDGKHKTVEIHAASGEVEKVEDEGDEDGEKDESLSEEAAAKAKTTLLEAVAIALKEVPGGKAFGVSAKLKGEVLKFGVEVMVGEKFKDVKIDAATGKVLKVKDE